MWRFDKNHVPRKYLNIIRLQCRCFLRPNESIEPRRLKNRISRNGCYLAKLPNIQFLQVANRECEGSLRRGHKRLDETRAAFGVSDPHGVGFRIDDDVAGAAFVGDVAQRRQL